MRLYELKFSRNNEDVVAKWYGKDVFIHATRDGTPPRFSSHTQATFRKYEIGQPSGINTFSLDRLVNQHSSEEDISNKYAKLLGDGRFQVLWILKFTGANKRDLSEIDDNDISLLLEYTKQLIPAGALYNSLLRKFNTRRTKLKSRFKQMLVLAKMVSSDTGTTYQVILDRFYRKGLGIDLVTDYTNLLKYGKGADMGKAEGIFTKPGSYTVVDSYKFNKSDEARNITKFDVDYQKGINDTGDIDLAPLVKQLNGNEAKTDQLLKYILSMPSDIKMVKVASEYLEPILNNGVVSKSFSTNVKLNNLLNIYNLTIPNVGK